MTNPQMNGHDPLLNFPQELRERAQWIAWKWEQSNGKPTKTPYIATTTYQRGYDNASSTNARTWVFFTVAQACWRRHGYDGVGYVFTRADPYCVIDLDHCIDKHTGEPSAWARRIIDEVNSYTELSPSGTGVHIITRGYWPRVKGTKVTSVPEAPESGFEAYDHARYITVTGNHLEGTPHTVEARQDVLDALAARYAKVEKSAGPEYTELSDGVLGRPLTPSERVLFETIRKDLDEARGQVSKPSATLKALWRGEQPIKEDGTPRYTSESEADFGFLLALLRRAWKRNWPLDEQPRVLYEVWLRSGLRRDKTRRLSYARVTLQKVLEAYQAERHSDEGVQREELNLSELAHDDAVKEAIRLLAQYQAKLTSPHVYAYTDRLVYIRYRPQNDRPFIHELSEEQLQVELARAVTFVKFKKDEKIVLRTAPKDVARAVLTAPRWPGMPVLAGLVEVPAIRPDGSILQTPGYDRATRLFYHPLGDLVLPSLPDAPTKAQVETALALLNAAIGEFPFADASSKANLLGLMLSLVMRHVIEGHVPLALIDAPSAGTGKSLLAEVVAIICTGSTAAMQATPESEAEWRKMITSVLLDGYSIVVLDNVTGSLRSPSLSKVLTAPEWSDRLLSKNEIVRAPSRAIWIATGNNIRLGGDLTRRCYRIRLNANVARPWTREKFTHQNLVQWVTQHRGELFAAVLTLCRYWYVQGCPKARTKVTRIGSYEHWCELVGNVLDACGVQGFLSEQKVLWETNDESRNEWEAFLWHWYHNCDLRSQEVTTEQVAEQMLRDDGLRQSAPFEMARQVDQAKRDEATTTSIASRLGYSLRGIVDNLYGDDHFCVKRVGMRHGKTLWKVEAQHQCNDDCMTWHTEKAGQRPPKLFAEDNEGRR